MCASPRMDVTFSKYDSINILHRHVLSFQPILEHDYIGNWLNRRLCWCYISGKPFGISIERKRTKNFLYYLNLNFALIFGCFSCINKTRTRLKSINFSIFKVLRANFVKFILKLFETGYNANIQWKDKKILKIFNTFTHANTNTNTNTNTNKSPNTLFYAASAAQTQQQTKQRQHIFCRTIGNVVELLLLRMKTCACEYDRPC